MKFLRSWPQDDTAERPGFASSGLLVARLQPFFRHGPDTQEASSTTSSALLPCNFLQHAPKRVLTEETHISSHLVEHRKASTVEHSEGPWNDHSPCPCPSTSSPSTTRLQGSSDFEAVRDPFLEHSPRLSLPRTHHETSLMAVPSFNPIAQLEGNDEGHLRHSVQSKPGLQPQNYLYQQQIR